MSHRYKYCMVLPTENTIMRLIGQLGITATVLWLCITPVNAMIGAEVAVPRHLQDGEEFAVSLQALLAHGFTLFTANWTIQEGGGRPLTKGTGAPLSDPSNPLVFPRSHNRISAPDANSCAGCHNAPFGIAGGGGDFVTSVFVLGQRFDFATFDPDDSISTKGVGMKVSITPCSIRSAIAGQPWGCLARVLSRCWRAK